MKTGDIIKVHGFEGPKLYAYAATSSGKDYVHYAWTEEDLCDGRLSVTRSKYVSEYFDEKEKVKEWAREVLMKHISNRMMPVFDQVVLTHRKEGLLMDYTFRGLLKIAYDLKDK